MRAETQLLVKPGLVHSVVFGLLAVSLLVYAKQLVFVSGGLRVFWVWKGMKGEEIQCHHRPSICEQLRVREVLVLSKVYGPWRACVVGLLRF